MRRRHEISDASWLKIKELLPGKPSDPGRTAEDNRLFLNAVLWIARTGSPWRDLPERFGPWNTVFQRFNRWCKRGVWQAVLEAWQDPDLECLLLDSTIVRAHQHAAGAAGEKKGIKRLAGREAASAPNCMSLSTPKHALFNCC
jgi:transposase